MKEHVIYQSTYFDNMSREEILSEYATHLADNDRGSELITATFEDADQFHEALNQQWFYDEHANLNRDMDILCIADVGTWQGRRQGYKELQNLNEILSSMHSCDYVKFYVDRYNVHGVGIHHDGSNRVIYRKWKANTTDAQREKLCDILYCGEDADAYISKYTASLVPDLKAIFGW